MSNKKDNNNHQEHHPGKGGSQNGNKSYVSVPPSQPAEQEDEIDLVELAKHFWRDRKVITKIVGIFVIIGIFIALFSSVEYTADAVLMPELQTTQSKAQSLLQKYGGMLGISSVPDVSESIIYPIFYPKIVESVPYNLQLMDTPVAFSEYDTTTTPFKFYKNIYSPSLIGYISQYTIGLPGLVLGLFKSNEPTKPGQKQLDPTTMKRDTVFNLSLDRWQMVKLLRNSVSVQVDQTSGLITLSASMPDPVAAAQLTQAAIGILTEYITKYRTKKSVDNLQFIQEQVKETKQNFDKAQEKLATFRDNNLSLASARSKSREQDLQSEYNLAFNLYNSLSQQLQQAKIRVQMQTPAVSILQPVTVPKNKSKPQRKLIVIVFLILGIIVALGWSLIRDYGKEIIQEVRSEEPSNGKKQLPEQEKVEG